MKQETIEEAKFVTVKIESATGEDLGKVSYIPLPNVDYVPKEETLEEAGKDYIENTMKFSFDSLDTKTQANRMLKCVEFGAKWQAERSYNEEEMIAFGEFIFKHTLLTHSKGVKNLFEQFKKK